MDTTKLAKCLVDRDYYKKQIWLSADLIHDLNGVILEFKGRREAREYIQYIKDSIKETKSFIRGYKNNIKTINRHIAILKRS